jgi:microcystin-dependent protein
MAQPYIGEIRMFAGTYAPAGWLFCSGQVLPISENETLFQLIGTTYGGDGESSFALPNIQSRVPMHRGNGPDGVTYPLAQMAGTEQETLTTQQIPSHTHSFLVSTNPANTNSPVGNVLGEQGTINLFLVDSPNQAMKPGSLTPVGGSQPHDNTQPYLCINYIISLFGIFPSPT